MKFIVLISALMSAGAVQAQNLPWNSDRPSDLDAAKSVYAEEAYESFQKMKEGSFGADPEKIIWDYGVVKMKSLPMSNMSKTRLSRLFSGKYHILSTAPGDPWHIRYYAPDGTTHFCYPRANPADGYAEWSFDRYIASTTVGLAGIMHWSPTGEATPKPVKGRDRGYPVVLDSNTGEISTYYWTGSEWKDETGWLQNEFPTQASVQCSNLPRVNNINHNQAGDTLAEISRNARPVRGFKTEFRNNPRNPLTAEMFYYLYPPK